MDDLELKEEHRIFKNSIRGFAEKEIAPLVDEYEEREEFPLNLFPRLGEFGYLCLTYPEEYGAAGADYVSLCLLAEEMGKVNAGITSSIMSHSTVATSPLEMMGTKAQKQKYLVPAIKGEKIFSFALTEPNAGSDVSSIQTSAFPKGGRYIINGSKIFITNAPFADYYTVAAVTEKGKGINGISIFLVAKETPGFTFGRKIRKMGACTSETGELFFENCSVPQENLVGPQEGGFRILMRALNGGRMVVGARCVGIAQAAFDVSLKYSKERVQFGEYIGKFQAIQFKLAEMATQILASRLMVYHAAKKKDNGHSHAKEASMAKLMASEMAIHVTYEAVQILGSYGYSKEFPVERYSRDARLATITEGTSEIQRIIIARRLGL